MNSINMINNDSEANAFTFLGNELLNSTGNKEVKYYCNDKLLVIYEITRGKVRNTEYQTELPLEAMAWLKDIILNGFWRLPSQGGLPKDQHRTAASFAGEEIIIARSMNAGEYEKTGFKIVNKSRKSHILSTWPQEFQISDERVEKVLLPLIEKLGIQ